MKIGFRTKKYLYKPYKIGIGNLKINDYVWIHPSKTSIMREKYKAKIEIHKIEWVYPDQENPKWKDILLSIVRGFAYYDKYNKCMYYEKFPVIKPEYEICTQVKGKWGAVLNDYLFDRLEKIK